MKALLTLVLLAYSFFSVAQNRNYNIDAEELDAVSKMPKGWILGFNENQRVAYKVQLDTAIKYAGRHAFSFDNIGKQSPFYATDFPIYKTFEGREILLKGYIKTQNVESGYAGLWMRIDGDQPTIAFDNMESNGVKGNTEWKEYTIRLPYDATAAKSIHIGGLLVGDGKAWFDKFELFIDGKSIEFAEERKPDTRKASLDTAFNTSSDINSILLTNRMKKNLAVTGQFWGFLKYHHPAIAKGDYNWDAQLFRHLPQIMSSATDEQLSAALEEWLDKLPTVLESASNNSVDSKLIAFGPDYGYLFSRKVFSNKLTDKLTSIKNCVKSKGHYYVSFYQGVGNPKFENENPYVKMAYPDAGHRLLSLYRYWSMINYFFPYKDIIGTDWNEVLESSLADFVNAKNQQEYLLACLKLIAGIHDTHANVWGNYPALEEYKGKYKLPFKAEFIENKLVVTGYKYGDTLFVKQHFRIGDVITAINGKPVNGLIKHFLPYTAASNYDTQLRDIPDNFLLRGQSESFNLDLIRDGKKMKQVTKGLLASYYVRQEQDGKTGFKLLDENIGYVYPGRYRNNDLPAIKTMFKNTKGIIVDMRCYPSEFMPFTFGSYLKFSKTPFVKFTSTTLDNPGQFMYSPLLSNGGDTDAYTGKVVVIVNSTSQSQAEYTAIAFQSAPNVTVIGSTTSGADGNVSQIRLPGGVYTMISGLGIYYPDGTPTQRVGVRIDHVIKPTIKGLKEGRDELLEKAKQIIDTTKVPNFHDSKLN